jgi:beta-RFAP synthase
MDSVTVIVPARLHLGFLDLNGSLGRKFGSIGIAINGPQTRLILRRADTESVTGHEATRAQQYLGKITEALGSAAKFDLDISECIPPHAGLGSGTQLSLAVAAAVRTMLGRTLDPRKDAVLLGRGERSGAGIGLFSGGGAILDGGRRPGMGPAPVISQIKFPHSWRIILVLDSNASGINGAEEIKAFADLPIFPEELAAHLCRIVLMKAWPSLIEADIADFGSAVTEIQQILGDHFSKAQGGRYSSPAVASLAALLSAKGAFGCGQSSWGPTGFAFAESAEHADHILQAVNSEADRLGLSVQVVTGNNRGAVISPGSA